MGNIAEATVRSLLEAFGDACVVLTPDLKVADTSPSFSELLQRKAEAGRDFTDFIDSSEHEVFHEHIKSLTATISMPDNEEFAQPSVISDRSNGEKRTIHVRSVKVHLIDAYGIAVAAHLY